MEKLTEWHIETPRFVIANSLSRTPFILSKTHEKEIGPNKRRAAEKLVDLLYDDWDLVVTMDQYPDHWHGHLIIQND
jgi:hypothetical protein